MTKFAKFKAGFKDYMDANAMLIATTLVGISIGVSLCQIFKL